MSVSINVNNLSLVHKASMGITMATIPDVCKTPSPGGPVPIPYPNISRSGSLSKGSKKVKADGGNMIAVKGSEFSLSNGDEPGTVGGVKSSTFMKEAKWLTYSFDVKIEGKNASRLTDKMTCNHGNTVSLGGEFQPPVKAEDLLDNLKKCDGGTNIYAKARAANSNRDPVITVGTPSSGFDAQVDTTTGTITINKKSDKCTATESLMMELGNLSRKGEFAQIHKDAVAGKLNRENYIRANERVEYNNVQDTLKAIDACKEKWGCENHKFDFEAFRGAKNFDDYYKKYLAKSHKEHYGKFWDRNFKP